MSRPFDVRRAGTIAVASLAMVCGAAHDAAAETDVPLLALPMAAAGRPLGASASSGAPLALNSQRVTREDWYGWQSLIAQGGALAFMMFSGSVASGQNNSLGSAGILLGASGLYLGGPVVHWSHGHVGKGFAALGLNVGGTLAGGFAGAALMCGSSCHGGGGEDFGPLVGLVLGSTLGFLTALVVDDAVLARETVVEDAAKASLTWVPSLRIGRDSTTVGLGAAF